MHFSKKKVPKKFVSSKIISTFATANKQGGICPDGGIGRRAGLKHQWSNPSRFDPGSGYQDGEKFTSLLFSFIYLIIYIYAFITSLYIRLYLIIPPLHENVYSDLFRISLSIFGFSKDNIYLCRRNNLYIITQQTEKIDEEIF